MQPLEYVVHDVNNVMYNSHKLFAKLSKMLDCSRQDVVVGLLHSWPSIQLLLVVCC